MTTFPGFDSVDHLRRSLVSFNVSTKKFTANNKEKKYHGGIVLFYDSEFKRLYIDDTDTHSLVFG